MNVLSLFDGMSCGQIALERAGIKVTNYFASEIDGSAIKVTMDNYPKTIQIGDVTKVKYKDGILDTENGSFHVSKIDLVIGGSPCQGFSFAGKQLNFEDPRSVLFFEWLRICHEVCPDYFLLENVKMKKSSENVITEKLGVEPIRINSALVSAHNRQRLYWTNIPNVCQPHDKGILLKDIIESGYVNRAKSYCIDANYFKGGNLKNYFEKSRRQLVFDSLDIHRHTKSSYRKLTPVECERLQTIPDNYTKSVSDTQRYTMLGNGWTIDVIAHIFKNIEQRSEFLEAAE